MQVVKDVFRQMLSDSEFALPTLLGLGAQRIVFETPLDADKHNALRYAAGYVLRSVKMRSKNPAVVAWIDEQRLSTNADSAYGSGDYLQFTREWVDKVNLVFFLILPTLNFLVPI